MQVEVANLAFIHTKKTTLTLTIEKENFPVPVLVARENVESLLGRKGLFNKFDVLFKENEEKVVFIKPGVKTLV